MIYRIVYNELRKEYKIQEKPWKWWPFWMVSSCYPWPMSMFKEAEDRIHIWKVATNRVWKQVGPTR